MTRGEVLERLDTLITAGHFDDMNSLFREHAVEGLGTHAGDRILSLSGHEGAYFSGWDIDFTHDNDLAEVSHLDHAAAASLFRSGIQTKAAVPVEVSSILAIHRHADPVALSHKIAVAGK